MYLFNITKKLIINIIVGIDAHGSFETFKETVETIKKPNQKNCNFQSNLDNYFVIKKQKTQNKKE